jgi:uncharacterized protein (TIGR03086 family)
MDHVHHLAEAVAVAVAAVRGADPARFDAPSPCSDWTVGQAVDHLAFGLLLADRGGRKVAWDPEWTGSDSCPYLRGVPEAEWADRAAEQGTAAAQAWAAPAAWEGEVPFGGGSMPAAAVGSMMTAECVLHAWDVATGCGRRLDVPEPLARAVLEGVRAIAPMGRDGGWFGTELPAGAEATTLERALALSGRDPGWRPA